jgi:vitamin B12 transporter
MYRHSLKIRILIFLSLFLTANILFFCPSASAQSEEEIQTLQMFFKEEELVVTPTRSPKPVSQVAENISVITAKEIEEMNYHTLPEVLNNIPGLQVDMSSPWFGTALIQGTKQERSIVKIDGVTVNYLSSNTVDFGAIPVQNIERIEIIKGPASSAWGSSLGGIINIITKPAGDSTKSGGTVSASYGDHNTGDYKTEASGRIENVGYYIYAGNFRSNGFSPNNEFDENNLYTKLNWDITKTADLLFTFGYNKGTRGTGVFSYLTESLSINDNFEYLLSTLSLNYSINDDADLSLSFRTSRKNLKRDTILDTGGELRRQKENSNEYGGSVKFTWEKSIHNLVIGADYDYGKPDVKDKLDYGSIDSLFCMIDTAYCSTATIDKSLENWAVFANDTLTFNKLSVTPGIRYDYTNIGGDFLSPSLGITYKLIKKTILRAYAARGFNTPTLEETHGIGFTGFTSNSDLEVEKVWSYQTGIETSALKYIWIKTTLFRHDIWDTIFYEELTDGGTTAVNKEKQRRQGVEMEMKTVPVYNTSLFAGYAYVDADNRTTGEEIIKYAKYTYDIGLRYNDNKSFMAKLKGHYIWWIPDPDIHSEHDSFIWDINITKKIYGKDDRTVKAFFTVHNIFNGSQYLDEAFKNPERWIEGGVKLIF